MKKKLDYETEMMGSRYGRIVVTKVLPFTGGRQWLEYKCDCGTVKSARAMNIRVGGVQSCGCLRREKAKATIGNIRSWSPRGRSETVLDRTWRGMIYRCAHNTGYIQRGITVCERWMSFENFREDMGHRPGIGYSLDRVDNDKGYEPSNCRWATQKQQMSNTSVNRIVEYCGKAYTVAELARSLGLKSKPLYYRIVEKGMSADAAVQETMRRKCLLKSKKSEIVQTVPR